MSRVLAVRWLALAVPLAAVGVAWWAGARRRRAAGDDPRREAGAALLAFLAALLGLAAFAPAADRFGWWAFADVPDRFRGVPVDLWLGWAALWGPLPALLCRFARPVPVLAALAWFDLLAMPALDPVLRLRPGWPVGELVGLAAVAGPAVLLGRCTADRRRLRLRAALQVAVFAGLLLWLLPTVAFTLGDGSWAAVGRLPRWQLSLLAQAAVLLAVPGLSAVREFVVVGGGTPYPWDPPDRLVLTGPYAYLANPMQCSGVALMALQAAACRSVALLAGAGIAVAFSVAVAEPHERADLLSRHGSAYRDYRLRVRAWLPGRQPYLPRPARLYLAAGCELCRGVAGQLLRMRPPGLAVLAAETAPEPLRRARYEHPAGIADDGVRAVARAVEHTGLVGAYLGWLVRLPVLAGLLQLLVDAAGGGPRTVTRGGLPSGPAPHPDRR